MCRWVTRYSDDGVLQYLTGSNLGSCPDSFEALARYLHKGFNGLVIDHFHAIDETGETVYRRFREGVYRDYDGWAGNPRDYTVVKACRIGFHPVAPKPVPEQDDGYRGPMDRLFEWIVERFR